MLLTHENDIFTNLLVVSLSMVSEPYYDKLDRPTVFVFIISVVCVRDVGGTAKLNMMSYMIGLHRSNKP